MFNYKEYLNSLISIEESARNVRFLQVCIAGEVEKINLLLDNKNLNVNMYFKDSEGNDGFRWACIYERDDVVEELLFKYDYKLTKRNLNYIVKSASSKEYFSKYLKMIETKELNLSLNKSLPVSDNSSKTKVKTKL